MPALNNSVGLKLLMYIVQLVAQCKASANHLWPNHGEGIACTARWISKLHMVARASSGQQTLFSNTLAGQALLVNRDTANYVENVEPSLPSERIIEGPRKFDALDGGGVHPRS